MEFRVLLIGDIVGRPGRDTVAQVLPEFVRNNSVDFVIANGENAAGGSGITPPIFEGLRESGVDVVTMGDHAYRKRQIIETLNSTDRLLRPANFPPEAAGIGHTVVKSNTGPDVAVINLVGGTFIKPVDCPFHTIDRILEEISDQTKLIFVDMHAEATSDKIAMGWHLDGRVSCVCGTHTHVQTADARILPGGTAYITDLGMTGPHDSILGRDKEAVLSAIITHMPAKFEVAAGDCRLQGALVTADTQTGRATAIENITLSVDQDDLQEMSGKADEQTE